MRNSSNTFWDLKSLDTRESIVLNTTIANISQSEPFPNNNGVYTKARVDIEFLTQYKLNDLIQNSGDRVKETNSKEITKIVYEVLKGYKDSLLGEVKSWKYGILEPGTVLPMVAVYLGNANISHELAGVDLFNAKLTILVYNAVVGYQYSIYQNLNIIDKVRKIVFANKFMLNKCRDHKLGEITYGVIGVDDYNYVSQFDVELQSFEPLN
jgi:hypothetical protein